MEWESTKLAQSPPLKSDSARIGDPALQTRRCICLSWKHTRTSDLLSVAGDEFLVHLECHRNAQKPGVDTKLPKSFEVSVRVQHMTGIEASAQLDGTGRERGVWHLKASGERHDELCPRCLAEGNEEKATMVHTVWQCLCCPTGALLSEGRAAPLHSSLLSGRGARWSTNWTPVGNSESSVGSDDVGPRHQFSLMDEVGDCSKTHNRKNLAWAENRYRALSSWRRSC